LKKKKKTQRNCTGCYWERSRNQSCGHCTSWSKGKSMKQCPECTDTKRTMQALFPGQTQDQRSMSHHLSRVALVKWFSSRLSPTMQQYQQHVKNE